VLQEREEGPVPRPSPLSALLLILVVTTLLVLPGSISGRASGVQTPRAVHPNPAQGPRDDGSVMASALRSLDAGGGPAGRARWNRSAAGGSVNCEPMDLTGGQNLSPGATPSVVLAPEPRYGAVMHYWNTASSTAEVLLFGGANGVGVTFGDTWIYVPGSGWSNVTTSLSCGTQGNCPSPRHDASSAFDTQSGDVLVFGGCSAASPAYTESAPPCDSSHLLGDTWEWTANGLSAGKWQKVTSTSNPSKRVDAALTYNTWDGSQDVLFGGCGSTCPLGDTWTFSGGSWTQCTAASCTGTHQPSARWGAVMAYQPGYPTGTKAGSVTLFGGCDQSSACANGGLNDTWYFRSSTWTLALASSSCSPTVPCPSPRYLATAAQWTTPDSGSVLLYGGVLSSGAVGGDATDPGGGWWYFPVYAGGPPPAAVDEWGHFPSWPTGAQTNSFVWQYPNPVAPPTPRYDSMLVGMNVFMPGADTELMFGGSSGTGSTLGDLWLDTTAGGGADQRISPPNASAARFGAAATYSTSQFGVLLYGGCSATCPDSQMWQFNYGAWTSISPVLGTNPPALYNASLVWDESDSQAILFGGVELNGTLNPNTYTFWWSTISKAFQWSLLTFTGGVPSARQAASMIYDPAATPYILLFGGCGNPCTSPMSDTWELSTGATPTWSTATYTPSPSGRYGAAFVYDVADSQAVLFGGCGSTCPLSDTWKFTGSWTQLSPSTNPSARWGAAMAYDSTDGYVVLFGGWSTAGEQSDTWKFLTGAWSTLSPANHPTATIDAILTNDPGQSAVDLIGGIRGPNQIDGEVAWEYSGGTWTQYTSAYYLPSAQIPVPRFGGAMAYDPSLGYALLVGGCAPSLIGGCGPLQGAGDAWLFQNGTWRQTTSSPGPRWGAALSFDGASGDFILFGGCASTSNSCNAQWSDTWTFDGQSWASLSLSTHPTARGEAGMAYDADDHTTILFGGVGCGGVCQDTWKFASGAWSQITLSNPPAARWGSAFAYDASDHYLLMVGGHGTSSTVLQDAWRFRISSAWIQISAGSLPGTRYDDCIAYDPVHAKVIVFGGSNPGGTPLSDTFAYSGGTWTRELSGSFASPPGRWGCNMMFDSSAGPNGMVVMFGGSNGTSWASSNVAGGSGPGSGETWSYVLTPNPILVAGVATYWLSVGYDT
jgi:hypothetical protein